jgi:hypothetical protein
MRRLLASLSVAAVALTATAALAQTDAYGRPTNPYQQYDNRGYDRSYDRGYDRSYDRAPRFGYERPQSAQRYGGGGIRILEAWYGRGRRVCDASHTMRQACEGQGGCTIKAGNELCGDPTPGVVKRLTVTYDCHGQVLRAEEREPGHIGLRC